MTKMTYDEWIAHEQERRKRFEEAGVTDINAERAKRMWADPSVKDQDIPGTRVSFDPDLGGLIVETGSEGEKNEA